MKQIFRGADFSWSFLPFVTLAVALMVIVPFSNVKAQMPVDPCPMPEALAKQSPPDMATVQADIDILTLCVERARLLGEFDTLAKDTEKSSPISGSGASSVVPNFENDNFDIDENDLSDFPDEASIDQILEEEGLSNLGEKSMTKKKKIADKVYAVQSINGNTDTGIVATLRSPDGHLVRVKVGDTLEDGSVVQSVSAIRGVGLLKQGVVSNLNWQ